MKVRNLKTGIVGIVPDKVGKALVKVGTHEKYRKPKPKQEDEKALESESGNNKTKKRQYKRRDMKAEK